MAGWEVEHTRPGGAVRENLAPPGIGSGLGGFEKGEGLVVTAAVEIVREVRIDWGGKLALEDGDLLGNRAQPLEMPRGITRVPFPIGNHGKPFAQGGSEGLLNGSGFRHGGNMRVRRLGVYCFGGRILPQSAQWKSERDAEGDFFGLGVPK